MHHHAIPFSVFLWVPFTFGNIHYILTAYSIIVFILTALRYIKIEDKEYEFNKHFRLILQTKLANPHYKPELQAQTTLINFTVTQDGLEDQLLAEAVSMERPDLETVKVYARDNN